ncbi:MAG: hypothetical protein R2710_16690 [Acidimicrobiales bacterium]
MAERTSLYEAKLRGLVREHLGVEIEIIESPGSAGGFVASTGYLLAEAAGGNEAKTGSLGLAERMLGPALLWAEKQGFESLSLLADPAVAGHLARRAGHFASGPSITVFAVDGTTITVAEPAPILDVPELTAAEWSFAGLIAEGGARAVDDHGRIVAEFAGLEVARVILDHSGERPAIPLLEVGVGQADRELHQLVHRDLDPDAGLRRAISAVAPHRRPGAPPHPLNRLARERWIRSSILDQPSLIDLISAEPVAPLRPRDTLLGTQPVAAVGRRADGAPVVVVCSVGVEVDLAAEAADYRQREDTDAELIVVTPPRDRYPVVERLVERLDNASLATPPPPWE